MVDENVTVYLGLGSNLGNRLDNLERALEMLNQRLTVNKLSTVYETEPEDFPDQPLFLNMVCEVSTKLAPEALLALIKGIEVKIGRVPGRPAGPRVIDIDILLYGDRIVETADLKIPHARMDKRAFVLVPLSEIAPELVPPGLNGSVRDLLSALAKGVQGVLPFTEIQGLEPGKTGAESEESECIN